MNNKYFKKVFFVICILILGISGCKTNTDSLSYSFEKIVDLSKEKVKIYNYKITVSNEYNKDQLTNIAMEIIEIAKDETPFNGLTVSLYDKRAPIERIPPLGSVEVYPKGNEKEAFKIQTGDYSSMQVLNKIKEKNWNDKPSKKDYQIIKQFDELLKNDINSDNNEIMSEDEIIGKVSKELDIKLEDVQESLNKCNNWIQN